MLSATAARVVADATAYAHRSSPIMANVAAFYTTPDDKRIREAWVQEFAGKLEQEETGAYVNFPGEDGRKRLHAAYPGPTLERLRQIKRRYDPQNLFASTRTSSRRIDRKVAGGRTYMPPSFSTPEFPPRTP